MLTGILLCVTSIGFAQANDMVDYASEAQRETWLRHPVLGDPSFDTFDRADCNPVVRGAAPYEWPVNGFLLNDPVSGNWYLYGGYYPKDYAQRPETPMFCKVFRSEDKGKTWKDVGPIFEKGLFVFDAEVSPAIHAPDVSVFYADGRYHMAFDWATENTTWDRAANPPADANSGVGYAWAEKPEGPFHRELRPIATTRTMKTLLGKYRRLYASTILKRANDWIVLTLTDSGPNFGWGLVGMTAPKPEGPYSEPVLLLNPEADRFHPPLLEFFPSFIHDGHIYSPTTAVALNRNYQGMFRVPTERAMESAAWELWQAGSVWHGEPVEHEARGIWGQTFSGFVKDDVFNVMYPSRDSQGMGTLNIASRPWSKPYRDQGFVLSGHDGPSLGLLKRGGFSRLDTVLEFGGTVTILLSHSAPLGPNNPTSGSTLHPLTLSEYTGIELKGRDWYLVQVDKEGTRKEIATGTLKEEGKASLSIERAANGAKIMSEAATIWEGPLSMKSGALGLMAAANSYAKVSRFTASDAKPIPVQWLYTEAILSAAQNMSDWEKRTDAPEFRYGVGVVSRKPGLSVKWNIEGNSFAVWAPKGPDFGAADVYVDGKKVGSIDYRAEKLTQSAAVFNLEGLQGARHAVRLQSVEGAMPVDTLIQGQI